MTEEELLKHFETALENKHPKFSWNQLIPETKFGQFVMLIAVLLASGMTVKEVIVTGRGILGLPTAIVENASPASIKAISDNLEAHIQSVDKVFDRMADSHYDLEKKTQDEMREMRGMIKEHTTQINTILSFRTIFPSP